MIDIHKNEVKGVDRYIIQYDFDGIIGECHFYNYDWCKSNIIDKLIRTKYPQDKVEAIINNHFLNISEWLDKKFNGEDVIFEDPDYDELQEWRKKCKEIADEALAKYPILD